MGLLDHSGCDDHGCQRHGDIILKLREQLLRHDRPRRAAGGAHKRLPGRDLLQKVAALLDGAQVRTDGNLDHIDKAQLAHGCFQLGGADILAKLADKRWRHTGINLPPPFHIIDNLENLTLIDTDTICREIGSQKVLNMVLLGAAIRTGVLNFSLEEIEEVMKKTLPEKFHEMNLKALRYA